MLEATEFLFDYLVERYEARASSPKFDRLYTHDGEFGHMFSVLHKELNDHFEAINGRAKSTHHYWADSSRELLDLIENLRQDVHDLRRVGVETALDQRYEDVIDRCEPWLSPSGAAPCLMISN